MADQLSDAHLLVAQLHRQALVKLSNVSGRKWQGLSVAGRQMQLAPRWKRKLRELDSTLGIVEKISVASCRQWLDDLDVELRRCGALLPPPPPPPPMDVGCSVCGAFLCVQAHTQCPTWCIASDDGEQSVANISDLDFLLGEDPAALFGTPVQDEWHTCNYSGSDKSLVTNFGVIYFWTTAPLSSIRDSLSMIPVFTLYITLEVINL